MTEDLVTTNTLLAIVAVASVLQTLMAIGLTVGGYIVYRKTSQRIAELERQVAPTVARVTHVLETFERVDATVGRMASTVRTRAIPAIGLIRGARTALNVLLR